MYSLTMCQQLSCVFLFLHFLRIFRRNRTDTLIKVEMVITSAKNNDSGIGDDDGGGDFDSDNYDYDWLC